ncbi:MAG: putative ABC transport system permease protein [Rhodothermales bacterium]
MLTEPGSDRAAINDLLQEFVPRMQAADQDRKVAGISAVPLLGIPTQWIDLKESIMAKIHPVAVWLFMTLALLVLAVACFNYMNIAIVGAMHRAKEIGVRKVVGSYRFQLVAQFQGENLVLSTIAVLIGVLMAEFLFIPWFNGVLDLNAGFSLNYKENATLWIFLASVLALTGIGAGLYPAVFISGFQPARVLKGGVTISGKKRLTKVLLGTQFVFSFLLLALSIAIVENATSERKRDWGYDQKQTMVVPLADTPSLRAFQQRIAQNPNVAQVASTKHHISNGGASVAVTLDGSEYEAGQLDEGFGYLETMKIRLAEGRFFDEQRQTDVQGAVVVNQRFIESVGMEDVASALGTSLRMGSEEVQIVGIVEDFQNKPFILGIDPVVFRVVDASQHRYLAIDANAGAAVRVFDDLKASWKVLSPELPFDGFFQDAVFDDYFTGMERSAQIFVFIVVIALAIAIMGLFGFLLITVSRRSREIGIRKVVGAGVWDVLGVVQKEMVTVMFVAVTIGGVLSYFIVTTLLNAMLPAGLDVSLAFVVLPAVLILTIATATSTAGAYRGANLNPIEVLRNGSE